MIKQELKLCAWSEEDRTTLGEGKQNGAGQSRGEERRHEQIRAEAGRARQRRVEQSREDKERRAD